MSNDENSPAAEPAAAPGVTERFLRAWRLAVWFGLDLQASRNWRALLAGLPALFVVGIMVVIMVLRHHISREDQLGIYHRNAVFALNHDDLPAAEVYFRRMATIDEWAPQTTYGLGLIAARRGDYDRARSRMQLIAPANATGYALAHLWLAKDILKQGSPLTPKVGEVLEHHLKASLLVKDGDKQGELHILLGQLYWSRGDTKSAIQHFEPVARERPELKLTLAVLYAAQKDTDSANRVAIEARDFFRKQSDSEPKVLEHRLRWARSELLLKNYAEAVRILNYAEAMRILAPGLASSNPKLLQDSLVDVYIYWYIAVPENEPGGLAKRLELLNRAMAHGPNNPQVLTLLADLATREGEQADEARAKLKEVLTQGAAPDMVHAILGTWALQKGDFKEAQTHLDLAYERNPQIPIVLNNLACTLANREKPDLEKALKMAEAAKKLSNSPEISDTMGTILVRLGRHRQAATELETALRAFPDRATIHGQLAECYENLGDAELTSLHRRLAKQNKPEPTPPGSQTPPAKP